MEKKEDEMFDNAGRRSPQYTFGEKSFKITGGTLLLVASRCGWGKKKDMNG